MNDGFEGFYSLLLLIAIIISLRIYRGVHGRRYSPAKVMRLPVIYALISVAVIIPSAYHNIFFAYTLLFIPAGVMPGLRYGGRVRFFYQDGILYFKRSPVILLFWLISFIARVILEFAVPTDMALQMIVDSLMAFTLGLLIGEAASVISSKRSMDPGVSESGDRV